uniref:Uncharacterized protein LOC117356004 n=1 Tax=Geotrypetes seraphini TaxID=260995 RepID=A0A6P8QU77_GEOSA|nr:uncharacterized protein LOC117356004 [Geotrypetes seraphini]
MSPRACIGTGITRRITDEKEVRGTSRTSRCQWKIWGKAEMAANKSTKAESQLAQTSGSKRSKHDPPTPEKRSVSKHHSDSSDIVLDEIRALKDLITKQYDITCEMRGEINSLSVSFDSCKMCVEALENRADMAALSTAQFEERVQQRFKKLDQELEDLSNRNCRNNIRIIGLAECAEGSDLVKFLTDQLPKILHLSSDLPLQFERAAIFLETRIHETKTHRSKVTTLSPGSANSN